jgi:hypothetical protein
LNELKRIFSITELTDRFSCSENTVIDYIESGELPVYVKSYIVSYEKGGARLEMTILRKDAKFSNQLVSLLDEFRSKNIPDNEDILDLKEAVNVTLGNYIELEEEDIAYASLDDFSQCFVCLKDVEKFEQNFVKSKEFNKKNNPALIKRKNDFNECISQVVAEFIEANGYEPTAIEEVMNRMRYSPPFGYIIDFSGNEVSVNGSSTKEITLVKRTIKRLLRGR